MRSLALLSRLVSVGVAAACVVATAGARPTTSPGEWLEPVRLSSGAVGGEPEVAIADAGIATALWYASPGLEARRRSADGSWGPASRLPWMAGPRLAVDRLGDALVVGSTLPEVVAFSRAVGAAEWIGPTAVSMPGERPRGLFDFAGNAAGQAVVAWTALESGDPSGLYVSRAALRAPDGGWAKPENLGYSTTYGAPSVAIDARGNAVAVWRNYSTVYSEFRPWGGRWERAVPLSDHGAGYDAVRVVMNDRGDALAVWRDDGSGEPAVLSSLRLAGSSAWSPPARLPTSVDDNYWSYTATALDDSDRVIFVVARTDGRVYALTKPSVSAAWTDAVTIGDGGNNGVCIFPSIAVNPAGATIVVWGGAAAYSARLAPGSAQWERPTQISSSGAQSCFSRVDVDSGGNALGIWQERLPGQYSVEAAILDATPPVLAPTMAHQVKARRRATFTVTASDVWSSIPRAPLWRFGDGTSARGTLVRHAYRKQGSYRVTVTATDAAHNAAHTTLVVRVR